MMKQRRSKEEDSEDSDEQQLVKEMQEGSSKMKMKIVKFCGFEEKLKLEEEEDDEIVACFRGFMQQYVRVL